MKIEFAKPPVVEVVCGATFNVSQFTLKTVHVGLFWEEIRDAFPDIEEVAPLPAIMEGFNASPSIAVEMGTVPPLRRNWFSSSDGRHLIQLQEDRFLYNWKRAEDGDEYPRFPSVISKFNDNLEIFAQFAEKAGPGRPSYSQFELTYVNHIGPENGLDEGEGGLFVDHLRSNNGKRFLPPPESFYWQTNYALPESVGRLRFDTRTAVRKIDGARVIRLDVTARGMPSEPTEEGRRLWFDLAHNWITQGFADYTSAGVQRIWERK